MSQNSFEGNGGPLGLPLVSLWELFWRFYLSRCLFSSPVGPYEISHQFVQIEGEERAGTCHLQRLPQTFLGLVEPICVRLQGTNDAFGLATFAPDRLPDVLGNVPRPLALGLDAKLFDPLVGQYLQRCAGISASIVDQQRGGGVRPKDGAVPRQRLQGHLRLVHHTADQGPKDIPPTEATQEIRQAKLHRLARPL